MKACKTCVYYNPSDKVPSGECRRHAPQVVWASYVPAGAQTFSAWPVVCEDRWCGEYGAKLQLAPNHKEEE